MATVARSKLQIVGAIFLIDPHRVKPMPGQPRTMFRQDALESLAKSIKEDGQKDPVKVVEIRGDPVFSHMLVDGERRWRACKMAGLMLKACLDKTPGTNDNKGKRFKTAVTLNFHRAEHTPLEIMSIIGQFRDGSYGGEPLSQAQIAGLMGISQSMVSQYERLENLHPEIMKHLDENLPRRQRLPVSTAIALSKLPPDRQLEVFEKTRGKKHLQVSHRVDTEMKRLGMGRTRKRSPADHLEQLSSFVNGLVSRSTLLEEKITPDVVTAMSRGGNASNMAELLAVFDSAIVKIQTVRDRFSEYAENENNN